MLDIGLWFEQVISELKSQVTDTAPLVPVPSPAASDLNTSDMNQRVAQGIQELRTLPEQYELADMITQLKIIDRLGEQVDLELRGAAFDARTAIMKQAILRGQMECMFFALHRWSRSGHVSAMQLFDQLSQEHLADWSSNLLYEVKPRNLADVNKLIAILRGDNTTAVRLAAADALTRSEYVDRCSRALLDTATSKEVDLDERVGIMRALGRLAKGREVAPEIEAVLLSLGVSKP